MRRLILSAALALAACSSGEKAVTARAEAAGVETNPPNAKGQTPAFPGQTRAPAVDSKVAYQLTPVAKGLEEPWGLAFLPDGRLLVTEKPGRLRIVGKDGTVSAPVAGVPAVDTRGQGGLLGLALDPAFAVNRLVYLSFSEPHADGTTNTAVVRGKLNADDPAPSLSEMQVIFRQTPSMASTKHYGGRVVFARDGALFITTGERSILPGRMQAQRLDGTLGKVVRIKPDGSIPNDNPFVGKAGVRPEIWSIGHRNIQGAAINPSTGQLWTVEHGARGGDEINIPQAGKDYGWPTITYGIEYAGGPIGQGITQKAGMEQPVYYWDPVIAPSGMAFYTGDLFPAWKGSLFIGALAGAHLDRLVLKDDKVVGEERLLTDLDERIRDVIVGPDGAIYVATDSPQGRVLKLTPK